jgi:hypothetical protein
MWIFGDSRIEKLEKKIKLLCPHKQLEKKWSYICYVYICELCGEEFYDKPKGSKVKTIAYV